MPYRKGEGGQSGLFPAKAGPTGLSAGPLWDRLQPGRCHLPYRKSEGVRSGLFSAEAGPTGGPRCFCGTGFSREGVTCRTAKVRVFDLASSRLKPVLLDCPRRVDGIGCSREGVTCHTAKVRAFDLASSRLKPVPLDCPRRVDGIGCSREGVSGHTAKVRVFDLASSRLKPVLLEVRGAFVGPASAGKASPATPQR